MRIHKEATLTGEEYRKARRKLGLTQEQLAYEVGTSVSTIKKRENGEHPVHREAQMAIRLLLIEPPSTPSLQSIKALTPKSEGHTVGGIFGLFTILDVRKSYGPGFLPCPTSFTVRCSCGRVKKVMAASFHHRYTCSPKCPAHAALLARGSHVDTHGDILDKDGFLES